MSGKVWTSVKARMFVAVPIPYEIKKKLGEATEHYESHIKRVVPEENWQDRKRVG